MTTSESAESRVPCAGSKFKLNHYQNSNAFRLKKKKRSPKASPKGRNDLSFLGDRDNTLSDDTGADRYVA
jgi:hypothetical protein